MRMSRSRMRGPLVFSTVGEFQALLGVVRGGSAPVGEALVQHKVRGTPARDQMASVVVLVAASTDCNPLVA